MAPKLSPSRFAAFACLAVVVLLEFGGGASAPGILEVNQTFSAHLVTPVGGDIGGPIMGYGGSGGVFAVTRVDGLCSAHSLRLFVDEERIATIDGATVPPAGVEIHRVESSIQSGTSCIPNPVYDSTAVDLPGLNAAMGSIDIGIQPDGFVHRRYILALIRPEGGCGSTSEFGSPICKPSPGATDFTGDGDLSDRVLAYRVFDLNTNNKDLTVGALITTSLEADGLSLSTDGTTIAYFLTESTVRQDCGGGSPPPGHLYCNGDLTPGADLDGDGYIGVSRSLRLFKTDTGTLYTTNLSQTQAGSCPRAAHPNDFLDDMPIQRVSIANGLVAFDSDEQAFAPEVHLDPGGTARCDSPAKPEREYNDDADTLDRVVRYFSMNQLPAAGNAVVPVTITPSVGPVIAQRTLSGINLVAPAGTGTIGTDGTSIAYVVREPSSGGFERPPNCTDLTHDCDDNDNVLQTYHVGGATITNTGEAVTTGPMLPGGGAKFAEGVVSFLSIEGSDAPFGTTTTAQDANGDGDNFDTLLKLYEVTGKRAITTNLVMVDSNSGGPGVSRSDLGTDGAVSLFVDSATFPTFSGTTTAPGELHFIRLSEGVTVPGGGGGGGMNSVPVANGQSVTTTEDVFVGITLTASDPDGQPLTYTVVGGPAHGVLSGGTGAARTYTPNANFNGFDSFSFKVNDGQADSNTATVAITITAVNDSPAANAQSVTTNEDTATAITLTGSDADGDGLAFTYTQPAHGTVTGTAPNVMYTPAANYFGGDSFTFSASDGSVPAIDVLSSGLVGLWRGDGSAIDSKGGNHGVLLGGTSFGGGRAGQAFNLDGIDDYVSIPDSPALRLGTTQTLTAWIRPTAYPAPTVSWTRIAGKGDDIPSAARNYTLWMEQSGKVLFQIYNGATFCNAWIPGGGTNAPLNTWTHLAGIYDGVNATLWVNGAVVVSVPCSIAPTSDDPFTIGYAPGQFGYFQGQIDEVGLWNRALSAVEMTALQLTAPSATVSLTVNPVNDAPLLALSTTSVTRNEDAGPQSIAAFATATHGPGESGQDPLTYTVTNDNHALFSQQPVLSDGSSSTLTFTPAANASGTATVSVTVTDGGGIANGGIDTSMAKAFEIIVNALNDAPVISSTAPSTAVEDTPYTYTATATDPDGPATTWSLGAGHTCGGSISAGGTFTFTPLGPVPPANCTLTIQVCDGATPNLCASQMTTVAISAVNDPPVASAQSVTTNEDTPAAITLVAIDLDSPSVTFNTSGPSKGTLTGTGANRTYAPNANFNGSDTFTFTASDGSLTSNTATVSITVTPVNDAPVPNAQSVTTNEDTATSITLAATEVDGDPLTYTYSQPANGTVTGTAPNVTYTPNANFNGTDGFTFSVSDGGSSTAISTSSPGLVGLWRGDGDANDSKNSHHGSLVGGVGFTGGLLGQAFNFDGTTGYVSVPDTADLRLSGPRTITAWIRPTAYPPVSIGWTRIAGKGDDTPTAARNFALWMENNGKALFQVYNGSTFCDAWIPGGGSNVPLNAWTHLAGTHDGANARLWSNGVLLVSVPCSIAPTSDDPLTIGYAPGQFAHFQGQIDDVGLWNRALTSGELSSLATAPTPPSATVSITVNAVNDAPVAASQSVTTAEDTPVSIALVATDVDLTNTIVSYEIVDAPDHGALSGTGANLTYSPAADYNGADSFAFRAVDSLGTPSNTATVNITVTSVNDAPQAVNDVATTDEDTAATVMVLANDTDADGDTLSIVAPDEGYPMAIGSVAPTPDGQGLIVTAPPDFHGVITFTYKITDGTHDQSSATVTVTFAAVNDAPVAASQSVTTAEDTPVSIALVATDVDLTNTIVSYEIVDAPDHGALSGTGANLTYSPAADYNGAESFTFRAVDSLGTASNTATVSITVTPVNDAPAFVGGASQSVAVNAGPQSVFEWATSISAGPANESGQVVSFTVTNDNNGLFSTAPAIAPNGALTHTPAGTTAGVAIVTVRLSDNGGTANGGVDTSPAQTFTITLNKVAQTITFPPIDARTYGDPDFDLLATAGSGLSVTYAAWGACQVSGATVHITSAGECTITASQLGNTVYLAAEEVARAFTIGKAATTTTVSCAAGPFSYSGAAQMPCTASVTGAGGLNESLTVSYANNTDAGTASASASYAETANYAPSSDSETFTIGKAATTTIVSCSAGPFSYTGAAHTPCTASVTGAGGLSESLTVNYSNNTDAGTASASASYAETANYAPSSDSETFTIGKAATTTIVSCSAGPFTYTGVPQMPCTASVTGAGGLNEALPVSYANNTNAGTAIASARFTETANYTTSSDSESFAIGKAILTVKADDKTKSVGAEDPVLTYQATGLQYTDTAAGVLTGALTRDAGETAGTYAIRQGTLAPNGNYTMNFTNGTLTIASGYSTCLLYDPAKPVKTGATIPIKIQVCSGATNVSAASIAITAVALQSVTTNVSYAVGSAGSANPDGRFRFDPSLGPGYIYNLKTTGLPQGTYRMEIRIGSDPNRYYLTFQVRQ